MRHKTRASADSRDTTSRLLDAAERLFGKHGYDGIGMRALAQNARVNLGAATYHYGSKRALYVAAFMRRFRPIYAEQLSLLRQAQGQGRPLSVDIIVDCMVRPVYAMGLAHPSFSGLLARNLLAPPAFMHAALHREVEQTVQEYIAALRPCLPRLPENLVRARCMFAMGSLLFFSASIGRLPPIRKPPRLERVFEELARFISAGLQAEPTSASIACASALRAGERVQE